VAQGGIQSAMCAPLRIGTRPCGLLYVDNLSNRGMFTVDDLNAFAVIAAQAGLLIERMGRRAAGEPSAEKEPAGVAGGVAGRTPAG
jgi:GAF domain-containing protein